MLEEVTLESQTVQETMLLPLWGRARARETRPDLLIDPHAEAIIAQLDCDFSTIEESTSAYGGIGWIIRARRFDDAVKAFIAEHPDATVVNLGASLDTTFSRVDNGRIRWVDLDLPDAIVFRKRLIPETERSQCIARSVFDRTWFAEVPYDPAKGVLFLGGGLFMYFEQQDVRELFAAMAQRFPRGELLFDALSGFAVNMTNKRAEKAGMEQRARSAVNNARKLFPSWSPKLQVVDTWVFHRGVRRKPFFSAQSMMMNMADLFGSGKFVHLRFLP
jgi:O-methyltransferase involved in polyketide biosynthesis